MRRVGNSFTTFYGNKPDQWVVLSDVTVDPADFPSKILIGLSTVNGPEAGDKSSDNGPRQRPAQRDAHSQGYGSDLR